MKFHPLSARFLFFKKAQKIGQKIKISPYPFSPHFHGSFMGHAILPTRIQTITICQMMTMMMTYCSNLMAMTLDSMAYLKNNDGIMHVGIICAVQWISIYLYTRYSHSDPQYLYYKHVYIPLMDRVNSMVMVEKLKRSRRRKFRNRRRSSTSLMVEHIINLVPRSRQR
jgi:hypothetical protein